MRTGESDGDGEGMTGEGMTGEGMTGEGMTGEGDGDGEGMAGEGMTGEGDGDGEGMVILLRIQRCKPDPSSFFTSLSFPWRHPGIALTKREQPRLRNFAIK